MTGCKFSKLSPPTGAVHWRWLQHGSDWKRSSVLGQPNIYCISLCSWTNSFRFFLPAISLEAKVDWGYLPIAEMFEQNDAKPPPRQYWTRNRSTCEESFESGMFKRPLFELSAFSGAGFWDVFFQGGVPTCDPMLLSVSINHDTSRWAKPRDW